jgi:hypothetical protein
MAIAMAADDEGTTASAASFRTRLRPERTASSKPRLLVSILDANKLLKGGPPSITP